MRNASERSPVSIKMAVFGTFQNVAVQNVALPSLKNSTLKLKNFIQFSTVDKGNRYARHELNII